MSATKADYCVKMKKFDLKKMKQNSIIVVIGKRASGKSTLVKDILFHNVDIPAGCVISGTEEANGYYSEMIPSILIKGDYSPEHVKKLLNRQRAMVERTNSGEKIDPRAFFIMDDCMYDNKSWTNDKEVKRIFMNGRHYKLTFIMTMQFPLGIPPMLRTNVDYVFVLRDNIPANKKRIFDSYGGMFGSFPVFCQVVDKVTENYGCLVIDQSSTSNNILDTVYWYKSELHPPFKLCNEQLWRMDKIYKMKVPEPEDKSQELQMMKKSPRVFVQKLMDS